MRAAALMKKTVYWELFINMLNWFGEEEKKEQDDKGATPFQKTSTPSLIPNKILNQHFLSISTSFLLLKMFSTTSDLYAEAESWEEWVT